MSQPLADMTWEELAGKIDWEGGVAEAFSSYFGSEEFTDTELKIRVRRFQKAYGELVDYLEDNGGLL